MVKVDVSVDGAGRLAEALGSLVSPEARTAANREAGLQCQERTADHIARASVRHHATVRRLGANPTGHFEFAPGRVQSRSRGGGATGSEGASPDGVTVTVGNTPGILMAFGARTVTAKRARALTLPVHRAAYGKRVADMRAEGYALFRVKGRGGGDGVLMAKRGSGRAFAAYALRSSVRLPHLPDLMPTAADYAGWAAEAIDAEIRARALAAGLETGGGGASGGGGNGG